jgi:restriction system protein
MPVPDFQSLMRPVLGHYADGCEHSDVREAVGRALHLTEEELSELVPSKHQPRFTNRIAWALSYLRQAGLLESPRRSIDRLSRRGRECLPDLSVRIDIKYLQQFEEFRVFRSRGTEPVEPGGDETTLGTSVSTLTPDEQIRLGYKRLKAYVATELLT